MKRTDLCPVCKVIGKECRDYMRDDGERVVEETCCKLCGGSRRIKKEPDFYEESWFIESDIKSRDIEFVIFNTYEEEN